MIGRIVSHFEITEKIGEGGCGVVWKARDLNLPRFAALKFLSPHLADSEDARRRLRREAQAISLLSHPHIETIYEVGEYEGQLFLALEYLPGGSLHQKIRDLRTAGLRSSLRDVIDCALQVAEGLACAHRHGIIHRDIKPANILSTEENRVKITDFGLAQSASAAVSSTAGFSGTIPYMSPEQVQNHRVDHRTDIYSFGVTLFEMATGQQPFRGPNQVAVLQAIVHDPVPSLRRLRPDAPDELDRIVRRAMDKDPAKRYQRMDQVATALRKLRDEYGPLSEYRETSTVPYEAGEIPTPGPGPSVLRTAILVVSLLFVFGLAVFVWPWPQRCFFAPDFFAACRLPEVKHIGVLPFESLAGDEGDRALFSGLEQMVTAELAQLGRYESSLCVHRIETRGESPGLNLLVSGTTARASGKLRVTATLSNPRTDLRLRRLRLEVSERELLSVQDRLLDQFAGMTRVELRPELRSSTTAIRAAFESYLKGLGYLGEGELDKAIMNFRAATDEDRYYAAALAGLGETLREKHGLTKERQLLDQALEACERAVKLDPRQATAHESLGLIYTNTRRYDKAVEAFRQCMELDPLSTETRVRLARALEAERLVEEAEATYRDGVRLRPDCWRTHNGLGLFLFMRGRHDEAKQEYDKALELAPEHPRVLNNLGLLYMATDRLEEAATLLEKSLAIQPRAAAANNLGRLYFRLGCYADSARAFRTAINLGEEENSRIWGGLGEALLRVPEYKGRAPGAFAKAIALAEKELAGDPTNVGFLRMLANDCARLQDYDKALRMIGRALELAPKDVEVQFRAGLVYEMAGKRKLALDAFKAALDAGRSPQEICVHPDLEDLRRDPRFQQLVEGRCAAATSPTPKGCPSKGPALGER